MFFFLIHLLVFSLVFPLSFAFSVLLCFKLPRLNFFTTRKFADWKDNTTIVLKTRPSLYGRAINTQGYHALNARETQ